MSGGGREGAQSIAKSVCSSRESLEDPPRQHRVGGASLASHHHTCTAACHRACLTARQCVASHAILTWLMSPGMGAALRSSGSSSGGSAEDIPSTIPPKDLAGSVRQKIFLDYSTYMARFVPAQVGGSPDRSPSHGELGSPTPTKVSGTNPTLGAGPEC